MAHFDIHCADCEQILGQPFPQVHKWLDACFGMLGDKHRKVRHHKEGVEEIRKAWGEQAAKAAELHIMKDYFGTIYTDPAQVRMCIPTKEEAQRWH